jgi:hypothetical protein
LFDHTMRSRVGCVKVFEMWVSTSQAKLQKSSPSITLFRYAFWLIVVLQFYHTTICTASSLSHVRPQLLVPTGSPSPSPPVPIGLQDMRGGATATSTTKSSTSKPISSTKKKTHKKKKKKKSNAKKVIDEAMKEKDAAEAMGDAIR